MRFVYLVVAVVAIAAAGCKGGDPPPRLQTCGPNGECPNGFACNANDNLCYQSGATPDATPAHPAALGSDQKSHDFGDVVMGGVSVATTVTISNDGDLESGPLQPVLVGAGQAAYVMDGDCSGKILRKLETCHVNLTFQPATADSFAAALQVSGTPGGQVGVDLAGKGITPSKLITSPSSLDFGSVVAGQTSAATDVTIQNLGQAASGLLTISLGGSDKDDFVLAADGCSGKTLAGMATCTVSIALRPGVVGQKGATLTVSEAGGGMNAATLAGRAIAPASLSAPGTQDVGVVVIGTPSEVQITITNPGDVATGALATTLNGSSALTIGSDGCTGTVLGPSISCTVIVSIAPGAEGALDAVLSVTGTPGGTATVHISATAVRPGALTVMPTTQAYAPSVIGVDGETHSFTIQNTGGAPTGAITAALAGSGAGSFVIADDGCGSAPLAAGATCAVSVTFHPGARGIQNASLTASATPGGVTTVALSGTGQQPPTLAADATTASFGIVDVTQQSAPFTWGLRNSGDLPTGRLTTSVTGDTDAYQVGNTCDGQPLAAGANCSIVVTLKPISSGTKSLSLSVSDGNGQTAQLSATGTARPLSRLTVATSGNGKGTLSSSPAGITCGSGGSTCAHDYLYGTAVTLTPAADGGSSFTGWTGACTGTGACVVGMDQMRSVTATFTLQRFALTVTTTGSGAVTGAGLTCTGPTCTGTYDYGTQVTLTAAPATGWSFASWAGCTGSGNTCNLTINQAASIGATFTINQYALTVTATGGGKVTSAPAGISCGTGANACSASFDYGTAITLTAAADANHHLGAWTGACAASGTAPTCTLTVGTAPVSAGAGFAIDQHKLTITAPVGGTITASPAGTSCGAGCTLYDHGTVVTLTPAPASITWGDACAGQGATCSLTLNGDLTASGIFRYQLTVTTTGNGSVSQSGTGGQSCGAGCTSYPANTQVTLTPNPGTGWSFASWSGACSGSGACTVTVSAAKTVGATFTINPEKLTLTTAGGGTFSVTPAGTACGAGCTSFDYGTAVTIHASPSAGGSAGAWGGACAGTPAGQDCALTMNGDLAASATFELTVTSVTSGGGTISHAPAGTACGAGCSRHPYGTSVVLGAVPAAGGTVGPWTGACAAASGPSCTLSATQNLTAGVTFRFPLTVTTSGQGSVNVGSGSYDYNTPVTLTATPATGWSFGGWSGDCSGRSACTVTMTQARTVGATFTINTQALTLSTAGGGSFTVTPAGTSCGAGCTSYDYGTSVTIHAAPNAGATFGGWAGDCASAGAGDCTLVMNGNFSAAATFLQSITATTAGGGTIAVTSGAVTPVACGAGCTRWPYGATVTLSPLAAAPAVPGAWSGACAATPAGSACVLTLTSNQSAGLTFLEPLGVTTIGSGSVSPGSGSFAYNSTVTLTATAAPGWSFGSWTGCTSSTGASCDVTMNGARAVSATFTINSYGLTVTTPGGGSFQCWVGTGAPGPCTTSFDYGTVVTVHPVPGSGGHFGAWGGACAGTAVGSDCAVTMNSAQSASGTFRFDLAVSTTTPGGGTFSCTANGTAVAACNGSYDYGTSVVITGAATAGGAFGAWSGCPSASGATCSVTMTTGAAPSATFTMPLTTSTGGTGQGTLSPSSGNYPYGSTQSFTATPGAGSDFAGYGGDCSGQSCSVSMTAPHSVQALFNLHAYNLGLSTAGGGAFTCSANGGAAGACAATYPYNTQVAITAVPSSAMAAVLSSWGGACAGTAGGTCTLTMTVDRAASAVFSVPLQINLYGSGTVNPAAGLHYYSFGLNATVTGAASSYNYLSGWGGCTTVSTDMSTCTVAMNNQRVVNVSFLPITYSIVATTPGGGGFTCNGGSCSGSFNAGVPMTVTAVPNSGGAIYSWTSCPGSASGTTCSFTNSGNSTMYMNASFQFPLTVDGDKGAYVSYLGTSCTGQDGSPCTTWRQYGTGVTLSPSAFGGYHLNGWTAGPCSGSAACSFSLTGPTSAYMSAAPNQHTLTVWVYQANTGRIRSDEHNTICAPLCAFLYWINTAVPLATPPASGQTHVVSYGNLMHLNAVPVVSGAGKYVLQYWGVNNTSCGSGATVTPCVFSMPDSDVQVSGTFIYSN